MNRAVALAAAAALWAGTVGAQTCPAGPTGLVLSGGGVKGLAHIGVIRVLDSLGVRPDFVIGSSMGAVIGALYASGATGAELEALARRLPVVSLFERYDLQGPQALERRAPLLVWEEGQRGLGLRNATVNQTEINLLLSAALLRGNLAAVGRFDSLAIPFRAVATELEHGTVTVLGEGDLAQAVRASMAVPLVFDPVDIGGTYYLDGGLSQNIPVAAARAMGAGRVIVSDVTAAPPTPLNPYSAFDVGEQMLNYLFTQPAESLTVDDIRIRTELPDVRSLDFSRRTVDKILDEGRRVADSVLAGASCLGGPAVAPPPSPRAMRLGRVTVTPAADSAEVLEALRLRPGEWVAPGALATRLRFLAGTRWYRALWLHPSGSRDSVALDIRVRPTPRRVAVVGAAYHSDLGGQIWGGLVDHRVFGASFEGSLLGSVDRFRQEGTIAFRKSFREGVFTGSPTLSLTGANEDVRRFDAMGHELPASDVTELSLSLGVEQRHSRKWSASLGAMGHTWREDGADHATAGAAFRLQALNRRADPVLVATAAWTGLYHNARLVAMAPLTWARLLLRPYAAIGWGVGLPPQDEFSLGGLEGFPGLRIGERRGDREAAAGVIGKYPLVPPVHVILEIAWGRSASGGGLLDDGGWLLGGRVGLGADTQFGPISVEYGANDRDRDLLVVRLGRWF